MIKMIAKTWYGHTYSDALPSYVLLSIKNLEVVRPYVEQARLISNAHGIEVAIKIPLHALQNEVEILYMDKIPSESGFLLSDDCKLEHYDDDDQEEYPKHYGANMKYLAVYSYGLAVDAEDEYSTRSIDSYIINFDDFPELSSLKS